MADLTCPDGAGSINNEEAVNQQGTTPPYVVIEPCIGTWEISGEDDVCAQNEANNQAGYAAEIININGAPLNVFKLLGVHEQGEGVVTGGTIFGSAPAPGFPLSNINNSGFWHSLQTGSGIAGAAYLGIDFGINTRQDGSAEYLPVKPNWKTIGAVTLTQADTGTNFARQVRVETTDGTVLLGAKTTVGTGMGTIDVTVGPRAEADTITIEFNTTTAFTVTNKSGILGTGVKGTAFQHPILSITAASAGTWISGTRITFNLEYDWKRQGVFNLVQSGAAVVLNLQREILVKAVRVVPSLGTISGTWNVSALTALDSPPTNINNIQDLFFNENRDRDYDKVPLRIKAQYSINNSIADLSKFGLNILDQYSFVVSFPQMVSLLGRPLVTGDIIEVIPELQYDQNLKAVRKFLEVTDTGWASEGFSPAWKPTLYRFAAQQVLPSQETRDIFGTMDTQKYLVADSFFTELGVGQQIDTTPLSASEETKKTAQKAVPEIGDDFMSSTDGVKMPITAPQPNAKGQPTPVPAGSGKQSHTIEDGLPPNGDIYGEGYVLPDLTTSTDGDWFRLYYPEATKLPARLYRFSAVKNRWIYMETDRRGEYSSLKPSVRSILQSPTRQGLGKKQS